MMNLVSRFLTRAAPACREARTSDAAAIAALHATSFRRGWGEDEIRRLLADPSVLAQVARLGATTTGFIISRAAAGEAEILSVAVGPQWRRRGIAGPLLNLHLRRLVGLGITTVFLEVDEQNTAALRLYAGAGFREVGRRAGYYQTGATALVLRRDL
jgi:ribosomal-protein-alanine N-acetyltransferase